MIIKKFSFLRNLSLLVLLAFAVSGAWGQSVTAGDINGTLTDTTGAVIPGAKITVVNPATGETKTTTSSTAGTYRVSLLSPGTYKVTATAANFSTVTTTVTVGAGSVTTDDIKLTVGQGSTTVEVSAEPEIVNTTNGDVTTVFTAEQVQALPNPGNDLTYVAQTAPGSVMNTGTAAGGYGNFSSFGISGLSNMFTLDGGYENDPFLNLNNTGASNLTLGNNEVDTVTVVSPAYSSQFGGLGGAQVNEITASGTNHFHGNASYYWDGRAMNSNDWFNKQNQAFNGEPNQPVFVNANQWGASIGGPIVHDKLFFFVNTEGIRAVTPATGQVWVPSAALQKCSLGGDPGGTFIVPGGAPNGKDPGPVTYASCGTLNAAADTNTFNNPSSSGVGTYGDGIPFAAAPVAQRTLLTTIYNTYNNTSLRPKTGVLADPNDVSADTYFANNAANLSEWLLTARVDYKIGGKDNFYIHYKQDHGTQPTYTDLISPLFTTSSLQPAWEGQMNETHTFSPNIVNQLVVTGNYYSAPFQNNNNYLPVAPSTIIFESGDMGNTTYGGINFDFPQGRRVAGYQIIDDVSWTKGRNSIHFGYNFRRDNITDIQGIRAVTPEDFTTVESFGAGAVDFEHLQYFPKKPTFPVAVFNQGAYFEDAYKVKANLTLTAGLRIEKNSNPTCLNNCLQVLAYPTNALPTGTAVPYNAAVPGGYIQAGRHQAFTGYQNVAVMPRLGFNWQPFDNGKTVVRGGFGMFSDTFPGLIADTLISNAPNNFHAAVLGPLAGGAHNVGLDPAVAGSGQSVAIASNNAFQNSFLNGGTYATTAAAVAAAGATFSAPNFTTPAAHIKYPTYEEWSLAIERSLDSKTSISATYVGNHGYHEPVTDGSRNLTTTKAGPAYFPTLPAVKPITSFGSISNVYSGAGSNFNGVVLGAVRRSKSLTLQFNYEFSKALDEISNGGFEAFAPDAGDSSAVTNPANLHSNYGLADYNVKQNTTASFVYQVPSYGKGFVKVLTGGFEVSGGVFHQTGLPYSITQSLTSVAGSATHSAFANGSVLLLAKQLNNNFDHHCGGGTHALLPDGTAPSQCNFVSSFTTPTNFAQQSRNSVIGPNYTNVNMGAFKTFGIYHSEVMKLKLGAQFFNLFNHPNFQNPTHSFTSSNGTLGSIQSTVGAPTSILGSTGGSDASPRLIQLHGSLVF
jgi:Carboxypeptidase regulatory-like domain